MKRIPFLLFVQIVFVSAAVGQQPSRKTPTLTRYTVEGDGFSVGLHSRPRLTITKSPRKDGTERTNRSLTLIVNSVAYSIEIFENPNPRQPLEEFIAESDVSRRYDPATQRELTIDGFPGKEYSSRTDTTIMLMQVFATENRLFRFAATGPARAAPAMVEFFSSIRFGQNTDGVNVSLVESYDGERVYLQRDVDVAARLLKSPEPAYTRDARKHRVEGTVILRAVFLKTGRVDDIHVIRVLPHGLTEKAIEAARNTKFVPAMKDGKPVSTWMQLEYKFFLEHRNH